MAWTNKSEMNNFYLNFAFNNYISLWNFLSKQFQFVFFFHRNLNDTTCSYFSRTLFLILSGFNSFYVFSRHLKSVLKATTLSSIAIIVFSSLERSNISLSFHFLLFIDFANTRSGFLGMMGWSDFIWNFLTILCVLCLGQILVCAYSYFCWYYDYYYNNWHFISHAICITASAAIRNKLMNSIMLLIIGPNWSIYAEEWVQVSLSTLFRGLVPYMFSDESNNLETYIYVTRM